MRSVFAYLVMFVMTVAAAGEALPTTRPAVALASVFGDHMVLQQGMDVPVWGTADVNEKITVRFAGQVHETTADTSGRWRVTLKPMKPEDAGNLTVQGSTTVTLHDVLVGEVWICSGQSNMVLPLQQTVTADAEGRSAQYPSIRLFHVTPALADQPKTAVTGTWTACNEQTARKFSAVAYFFARDLHRATKAPIGIIEASRGASYAESWISRPALQADPVLAKMHDDYYSRTETTADEKQEWWLADRAWRGAPKDTRGAWPTLPSDKRLLEGEGPARLFNGMIAPLVPVAIRGAIWYQGEANVPQAEEYTHLLTTLILDWRSHWGQRFPVLVVQLPNYSIRRESASGTPWALMREAQAKVAETVPDVGLAVTIDTSSDGNLHPREKEAVGQRLAVLAAGLVYGHKVPVCGPQFNAVSFEKEEAVVTFRTGAQRLVQRGEKLEGFFVAGDDRKFFAADATIRESQVVLRCTSVTKPVAVRYAWTNNPAATLYNDANLPAAPFRTDNWEDGKESKPLRIDGIEH